MTKAEQMIQDLADQLAPKARTRREAAEITVKREAGILSPARQQQLVAAVNERLTARDWMAERNA